MIFKKKNMIKEHPKLLACRNDLFHAAIRIFQKKIVSTSFEKFPEVVEDLH